MEKEELIKKIMNCCFADDYRNPRNKYFWDNFIDINVDNITKNEMPIYYNYYDSKYQNEKSLPDPDYECRRLYEFHGRLWKKQRTNNIPDVFICDKSIWLKLNGNNITLKSDSFISIGWHYVKLQTVINKAKNKIKEEYIDKEINNIDQELKKKRKCKSDFSLWKNFVWLYLQKANTIGGFVVFPRQRSSINGQRGLNPHINDRFDLTLECIRRYYEKREQSEKDYNFNPLYNIFNKGINIDFFDDIFGSFKKYIDFFLLNSWVKEDEEHHYHVKNLLHTSKNKDKERNMQILDNWDFNQKPLPQDEDEWWTFYRNIMKRLDVRNQQIAKLLKEKCSDDDLQKLYNSLDLS